MARCLLDNPNVPIDLSSEQQIEFAQAVVDAEQIIRDARNVTRGRGPMFPKIGQRSDEWLAKHAGEEK